MSRLNPIKLVQPSPLTLALMAASMFSVAAFADQTWDGGGLDNNWSTQENWGGDLVPDWATAISFSGNTRNSAVNDLAAATGIGGINFTNDGSAGNTNAFTLSGASINLNNNITTTAITAGPTITDVISSLNMNMTGGRSFTTGLGHDLTVSGDISGNFAFFKRGAGTLTLSGLNTFGNFVATEGTVNANTILSSGITNPQSLGVNQGIIFASTNGEAVVNYTGTGSTFNKVLVLGNGTGTAGGDQEGMVGRFNNNGSGLLNFSAGNGNGLANGVLTTTARTLVLGGSNTDANTISNIRDNGTPGAGGNATVNFRKEDAGTWILRGTNSYTGTTTVNGGLLTLNGTNGTITASSGITINGGKLFLDNATNNNAARIGDTIGVSLSGGELSLSGNAAGTSESVGTLGIAGGDSTVTVKGVTLASTLAGAAFSRTDNGTALIRGTSLGQGTGSLGRITLGSTAGLSFVGATTLNNAASGNTTKNVRIVPYLVGGTTDTAVASTFITYDTTLGFRALEAGNFNTGLTSATNVRLTGNTVASSSVAINSLIVTNNSATALTINDGQTLTVSSGAILFTNTATIKPSSSTGILAFGSAEGVVTVNSGLTGTISAVVSGSGGLTKGGTGTLALSGNNSYTGATAINAGTLSLGQANTANDASTVTIAGTGATLDLAFAGTDTVDKLFFGAVQQPSGTYSASSVPAGATIKTASFSGTGSLTVSSDPGGGPGPLDHFAISAIASPQTAGTPITGITITAQDASNNTVTGFTGTVTFGGTGGFDGEGTSGNFTGGVLTGVSVTPTASGSNLTLTVTDSAGPSNGSTTIATIDPAPPGSLNHFAISAITSPQTVGTPITGITITAQDASNNTVTGFTGTVNFGGTGGFSGTSASFTAGVLTGVSVTPTASGSNLTLTVTDSASPWTGSTTITMIHGPGFPNVARTPGTILAEWLTSTTHSDRNLLAGFHRGYLWIQSRPEDGGDNLIMVYDISDPRNPVEKHRRNLSGGGARPEHMMFMTEGDKFLMPVNAQKFHDMSDMLNIRMIDDAPYTISRDGDAAAEFVQLPLQYNGQYGYATSSTPLAIRNIRTNTLLSSAVDPQTNLGFKGHPLVIGNLLIAVGSRTNPGVATYDVSDPTNPILLDSITSELDALDTGNNFVNEGAYEPAVWGNHVVYGNQNRNVPQIKVVDFSDPTNLNLVAHITDPSLRAARYQQFQDEYLFTGNAKIDMRDFSIVRNLKSSNATVQLSEYILPLGNLVVIGEHQGAGGGKAYIIAHQDAPDTRAPFVNYHNPVANATNMHPMSRVGVVIPETLDPLSINASSFIVRPSQGAPIGGTLTYTDKDIINFVPDSPLAANTTYEVVLPAGGIRDISGNGIEEFSFAFSTGSTINPNTPPVISSIGVSNYPATTGSPQTITVTASDAENDPLEYRLNPGDGSGFTAWQSSNIFTHVFAANGHFGLSVQVRDPADAQTISTGSVTVLDSPPSGPRPTRSSPITEVGSNRVMVVNPDNNSATSVNTVTLAKEFEAPVGTDPRSIALAGTGEIWITCHDADRLDVLSSANGSLITSIDLDYGAEPYGIAFSPDGLTGFVSLQGSGKLLEINPATRTITRSLDIGPDPRAIAITSDGSRVLVTRFVSPETHGEVYEVNAASMSLTRVIQLAKDTTPDHANGGRGVPNYLTAIAIAPDGSGAWVSSKKDNIDRGAFRDGQPLSHENSVRAILSFIDLTTNAEDITKRIDIDNSSMPMGIAFSPLGDFAFIAMQGNNHVQDINMLGGAVVGGRWASGKAPQGAWYVAGNDRLVTADFMDRTITVYDAYDFVRNGKGLSVLATIPTVANEALTSEVLLGKQIFYDASDPRMALDGYQSCAACHQDGGTDNRVWDFTDRAEGFRNTTDLRSRRGTSQGFVHWSANFDEIQDFEHDIRNEFLGDGFLTDAVFNAGTRNTTLGDTKAGLSVELDALAAYVTSLDTVGRSPHKTTDGQLTSEAIAGRALFTSLNCMSCHSGDALTNSDTTPTLRDVGTLKPSSGQRLGGPLTGIDTPTLRGLWRTAPYLHDGSAATMQEVLTTNNPSDLHGVTSSLTSTEIDALVAYLLQIDDCEASVNPEAKNGFVLVDDFSTYAPGSNMLGQGGWNTNGTRAPITNASVATDPSSPGNQVMSLVEITANGDQAAIDNQVLAVEDGSTATLFFRMRHTALTGDQDTPMGVGSNDDGQFGNYDLGFKIRGGGTDGQNRTEGLPTELNNLDRDVWFNVWWVITNGASGGAETLDLYLQSDSDADYTTRQHVATLTSAVPKTEIIDTLTFTKFNNNGVMLIDDIHYDDQGINLTDPTGNYTFENNLTAASVLSSKSIGLNWSTEPGAVIYYVEQSNSPNGPWTALKRMLGNPMEFVVGGLTPVSQFFFRVTAMTADGEILSRDIVEVTTQELYDDWAQTFSFSPSDYGKEQDPDNDGHNNLLEYAFGTDPKQFTGSIVIDGNGAVTTAKGNPITYLKEITESTVNYRVVFSRRKDFVAAGLTYTVEFSTLGSGSPWAATAATPTVMDGTDDVIDVVTVPYPASIQTANGFEKPSFFRIGVSQ